MDLDRFKLAAKRLRTKVLPSLGIAEPVSHGKALDLMAQIEGFRDYHEATTRHGATDLLTMLRDEPGGLLTHQRALSDPAVSLLPQAGPMMIVGYTGSGKSVVAMELVVAAQRQGRRVRMVGLDQQHLRVVRLLGGLSFASHDDSGFNAAWSGDASLVALGFAGDQQDRSNAARSLILDPTALTVVDEIHFYGELVPQLKGCPSITMHQVVEENSEGLDPESLLAFNKEDGTWRYLRPVAEDGQSIAFRMFLGPLRTALYDSTFSARHLEGVEEPCQVQAAVDRLQGATHRRLDSWY